MFKTIKNVKIKCNNFGNLNIKNDVSFYSPVAWFEGTNDKIAFIN